MREKARMGFQAYLDSLAEPYGIGVSVIPLHGGSPMDGFYAGVRVLSATPLFNRDTGEIERWRYWLLFAEMSVLDRFGCGHPLHFFECDMLEQEGHQVRLQDVRGDYLFRVSRNDPHSLSERQERIYAAWDAAVKEAGGESALQALLDRLANETKEELIANGEMTR